MSAEIKKKRLLGFQETVQKSVVRGSVFGPMGAHKLDDFEHKLIYPVMVQRKLDGFRCIAHFDERGSVTLYSKSMKPFTHLDHIKRDLKERFGLKNTYFDGELYSHGLKLNEISKLVMKRRELEEAEREESKKINYMLFDLILENVPFQERYAQLESYFRKSRSKSKDKDMALSIQLVTCTSAKNKSEVYKLNDAYLLEGYEGVIVRNKSGLYLFKKKSYDVLRTKEFKHGIFTILGGKEGSGTYSGTLIWELKCNKSSSKKSFNAIQMGSLQERKSIFDQYQKDPQSFIGKQVKVKYLMIDDYGCVLRNPIVEEFVDE
jgi:DNA ligase-1